jgi:hypothetical protein
MNIKPDLTAKDAAKDVKEFTRQPAKTKEIELLADQAEKSTGAERVESDDKIRAQSGPQNKAKPT